MPREQQKARLCGKGLLSLLKQKGLCSDQHAADSELPSLQASSAEGWLDGGRFLLIMSPFVQNSAIAAEQPLCRASLQAGWLSSSILAIMTRSPFLNE